MVYGFRRQVFYVVETDRTIGSSGGAKILQVGAGAVVQAAADPFVQTFDVRHLVQNFHADGRTENLSLRHLFRTDFYNPVSLPSFVGQETECRNESGDGAHQFDDAGVPVASCAEDTVRIDYSGRLRPREDFSACGNIADFRQITGAGIGVFAE